MEVSTKYCRYCGRLLRSRESIQRGYGIVCYKKHIEYLKGGGLLGRFRNQDKDQCMVDKEIS
jgi:hypothetical protein